MPENPDNSKEKLAGYLRDNDWEKELNYKLWVTKGARFCAAQRLSVIDDASTKALTYLSAYLIIIGLVPIFVASTNQKISPALLGLSTVGISILLLVYGLIESSKRYALRAHRYHDCALEIGQIYDDLRQVKQFESKDDKVRVLGKLTKKYERTLELFENHEPIDYKVFKIQKPDYFNLSEAEIKKIKRSLYYESKFRYHVLIVLPPLVMGGLYWML